VTLTLIRVIETGFVTKKEEVFKKSVVKRLLTGIEAT
jgi:hypothetical protein